MSALRYRLDDLGWQSFESLCQAILINRFAVGVQAWGGRGDWGRDAYYSGVLAIPDTSHNGHRTFIFQAKFVENANAAGAKPDAALIGAVRREIQRMETRPRSKCYVLITNVTLSSDLRTAVEDLLGAALPGATVITWGGAELCAMLDDLREVRLAFPQLLSLRDFRTLIDGIVHKPIHARSRSMLERATEEALVFVHTGAYRTTLETLHRYGMAILSGPPEMGKTTIAYAVALACAADNWRYFAVRSADEVLSAYEQDQRQIFIADDAFGTTEYKPGLADEWAASLDSVHRRIDQHHWVIWTTRTAPLRAALHKMHLQGRAEKFPDPGNVIIQATDLTLREKALMLYAHAKVANLAEPLLAIVRAHAERIVKHPFFTPKRVQRFIRETLPTLTEEVSLSAAIEHEIRTPTDSMRKSFDALPDPHKAFLIAAIDGPNPATSLARHAGTGVAAAEIEGKVLEHFIVRANGARGEGLAWAHPSWRDLVIDFVAETAARRGVFLSRCGVEGLALALSSGGGVRGERRLPFLKAAGDWDVLERRLPHLLEELQGREPSELLALIKDLDPAEHPRVAAWPRLVLDGIRADWDGTAAVISLRDLSSFYELSIKTTPLVRTPDLTATWHALLEDAVDELNVREYFTSFPALKGLWEACIEILRNEPRFLRQVGFPAAILHVGGLALDVFEEYLDADPSVSDREHLEAEVEQLDDIAHHVQQVKETFPNLGERATQLLSTIDAKKLDYDQMLEDGIPDRKTPRASPPIYAPPDDNPLDIAMLFSDL